VPLHPRLIIFPLPIPVLHIPPILFAAIQKSATLQVDLITCRPSHHPTSYRISVTALICCLFHSPVGLDTTLSLYCSPFMTSCSGYPKVCLLSPNRRVIVPLIVFASISTSLYLLPSFQVSPCHVASPLLRCESLHSAYYVRVCTIISVCRVDQVNKCYSHIFQCH